MNTYNDTLILATANKGKVREFAAMLKPWLASNWRLIDRMSWSSELPDTIEDADSFAGNAVKKAVEIARATGCCALSDDSGLEVDALGGAPGVFSARYAGEDAEDADNNRKLVQTLAGVPQEERTARFVSVVCLAIADNAVGRELLGRVGKDFESVENVAEGEVGGEGTFVRLGDVVVVWFRGTVEGLIVDEARGASGFGYDPHFYVPTHDKTMAELSLEAKNAISHRSVALAKLVAFFGG